MVVPNLAANLSKLTPPDTTRPIYPPLARLIEYPWLAPTMAALLPRVTNFENVSVAQGSQKTTQPTATATTTWIQPIPRPSLKVAALLQGASYENDSIADGVLEATSPKTTQAPPTRKDSAHAIAELYVVKGLGRQASTLRAAQIVSISSLLPPPWRPPPQAPPSPIPSFKEKIWNMRGQTREIKHNPESSRTKKKKTLHIISYHHFWPPMHRLEHKLLCVLHIQCQTRQRHPHPPERWRRRSILLHAFILSDSIKCHTRPYAMKQNLSNAELSTFCLEYTYLYLCTLYLYGKKW